MENKSNTVTNDILYDLLDQLSATQSKDIQVEILRTFLDAQRLKHVVAQPRASVIDNARKPFEVPDREANTAPSGAGSAPLPVPHNKRRK